jgi:hypothetical protein
MIQTRGWKRVTAGLRSIHRYCAVDTRLGSSTEAKSELVTLMVITHQPGDFDVCFNCTILPAYNKTSCLPRSTHDVSQRKNNI